MVNRGFWGEAASACDPLHANGEADLALTLTLPDTDP